MTKAITWFAIFCFVVIIGTGQIAAGTTGKDLAINAGSNLLDFGMAMLREIGDAVGDDNTAGG